MNLNAGCPITGGVQNTSHARVGATAFMRQNAMASPEIARFRAVAPKYTVCDGAVAVLDVSIQAQVINLWQNIQAEHQLTYLFISQPVVLPHVPDGRSATSTLTALMIKAAGRPRVFAGIGMLLAPLSQMRATDSAFGLDTDIIGTPLRKVSNTYLIERAG